MKPSRDLVWQGLAAGATLVVGYGFDLFTFFATPLGGLACVGVWSGFAVVFAALQGIVEGVLAALGDRRRYKHLRDGRGMRTAR